MRRVTAVLPTLGLTADWAGWSADHDSGREQQTPGEEKGSLPSSHPSGVDMGRLQTGSRRSPEGARQITTPVVLVE